MYRSIETDTWADPWFSELSAPGKLVFLYLITNNHVDAAGCCEITLRVAAFETGLEQDLLGKILPKLAPQIIWWPDLNIFWVRNFLRRQSANTNAANFFKSAARSLHTRPDAVIEMVCAEYPSLPMHPEPADTSTMHADASPMHAVTVSEPVSEPEQQQKKEKPPVSLRSTSPKGGRIPAAWPNEIHEQTMRELGASLGLSAERTEEHWREYHDYWSQSTLKTATSLDWLKRWGLKLKEDVREGKIGGRGRASPAVNGHRPVTFTEVRQENGAAAFAQVRAIYGGEGDGVPDVRDGDDAFIQRVEPRPGAGADRRLLGAPRREQR